MNAQKYGDLNILYKRKNKEFPHDNKSTPLS